MLNALTLEASYSDHQFADPVARLSAEPGHRDAHLVFESGLTCAFEHEGQHILIQGAAAEDLLGDVVRFEPDRQQVARWIRKRSPHNTLLITEQCDQLCVMCSQPPKKTHVDQFTDYEAAIKLAPLGSVIGLSGGEPTLHKAKLLAMMEAVSEDRPDIRFHVLTNGQHFLPDDQTRFRHPVYRQTLWGVPLYSADPATHDRIVKKVGAFEQLQTGLDLMAEGGLHIEMRTVVLRDNYGGLRDLARLITKRYDYIDVWAIMQLERMGFAKNRWTDLFHDHSRNIDILEDAAAYAKAFGVDVSLFNFPRCTVTPALRDIAAASISDWKTDYAPECRTCHEQSACGGLFAWHKTLDDYAMRGPL